MGMITTEARRPQVGEHHYRRAQQLSSNPSPTLLANLAWNLKLQGRMEESRRLYEESTALDPNAFTTLYGWTQMEETDRNFARAFELLDAAEKIAPGTPTVMLQRAVLYRRVKDYDKAQAALDSIERLRRGRLVPLEWSEKGKLLDIMGAPPRPSPPSPRSSAFCANSPGRRTWRRKPQPWRGV